MAALAVSGCDDDPASSDTDTGMESGADTGVNPDPTGEDMTPRYAVTSRVFNQDWTDTTSYVWLVDDLHSGSLDASQAIELPGGATIWGVPGDGVFYVVSTEDLTLTKIDARSGALQLGQRIGLSAAGATLFSGEKMVFADSKKGYLFDLGSAQALELDLEAMTIVRSIDLSGALIPSADLSFIGDPGFHKLGDRYVASVYGMTATWDRMFDESKIIYFDPVSGAVDIAAAPCGALVYSATSSTGSVYFSGDTYAASLHRISPESSPAPCLAQVPADGQPPSVVLPSLNDLTGAPTGGLIPGSDGTAFIRVLDSGLAMISDETTHDDLFSMPAWHTWQIDLNNLSAPAVQVQRAPVVGGIRVFTTAEHAYENQSSQDFSTTTLIRTTGADAPAPGLQMPGTIWGIVQVR